MSDLSPETRFKNLCRLYSKYKSAVNAVTENVHSRAANIRVRELDVIVQDIENFPISWKYYSSTGVKFAQDFEDLIIFIDE